MHSEEAEEGQQGNRMRRVVVTGMGVVCPIGISVPEVFRGLRTAQRGIDWIGSFDASTFPTRIAGEVKGLDVPSVALPSREGAALARDPKSLFALVAAREALAGAGWKGAAAVHDVDRTLAMIATGLEIFHLDDLAVHVGDGRVEGSGFLEALRAAPPGASMQIPADMAARVIARESRAGGGLGVNVSACAAGTQVIGEAFLAIRDGAADAAIAGGYDSMVNPLGVGGFSMLEALSRANDLRGGACRPFDARRDGFVLGEGAAFFVLEERSAALRRKATILAEILGYGSSLDAYRVTDPAPDHRGAAACMTAALEDACVSPESIDYINAHGTGTPKNDAAETAAIHRVFGDAAHRIPVSSTKSQIGHLIGAAGAVELVAVVFALRENILPATVNLEHPDPACDLDYVPGAPRPAHIRLAMSNSFGFGGQNASIVVGAAER